MNNVNSNKATINSTKDLVVTSLLIAIVFISTYFVQFHLPMAQNDGGLVHLGTITLIAISVAFGKRKGAISGALGMGLFDIISGYAIWAPFTFVIYGVLGYIVGSIANSNGRNGNSLIWNISAVIISGIWMVAGYYITNLILYQNHVAALTSIPGNALLVGFGGLGLSLVPILKKINL